MPKTRKRFWEEKIERNKKRDKEVNRHYQKSGWKVLRIWEHEIKKDFDVIISKAIKFIKR
jgi:DNA mismatch endonuclease (patch repair protein)